MEDEQKITRFQTMAAEIKTLLIDEYTLECIGDKTYQQYIGEYSKFMSASAIDMCSTISGHPIEVIKYYCDKYNKGKNEINVNEDA